MKKNEEHYTCICLSPEHTLRTIVVDEGKNSSMSLDMQLCGYLPWYKRLKLGIKYIFGIKSDCGHWDTFEFNKDSALKLKSELRRYLRLIEKGNNLLKQ